MGPVLREGIGAFYLGPMEEEIDKDFAQELPVY